MNRSIRVLAPLLGTAILSTNLVGCSTMVYQKGEGVVVSEQKIKNKDYLPHSNTRNGLETGAKVGAATGGIYGGILGLGIAGLFAASIPETLGFTLIGAGIGAAYVGTIGAATGTSIGYIVDVASPNAATYQYVVKPNDGSKPFTVTQYSSPIPEKAEVRILERNNVNYIEPK